MSSVVLAISGSLRKPSFTDKMLNLCLEGMQQQGGDFEVKRFYPHTMHIGPCNSCWSCWGKKRPGECVQKDDFCQILDVYKRADYILFAVPLYFFDFPATVKNVIDRFFIDVEPRQMALGSGGTCHPSRFGRNPKAVLISSCGFPEMENFELLRQHFRLICEHMKWRWSGEILVSAAGAADVPKLFDRKDDHIRKAGAELARGAITMETSKAIAAPVMSVEDYRQMVTLCFDKGLSSKVKMAAIVFKAMQQKGDFD
jgi:putative NADPH-quinone reductase